MHRRRETQVQVRVQPQVSQHADAESAVPAVLVADDGLLGSRPVVIGDDLWSHVFEFDVLHVHTHEDAEVQGAQVDIRLVLYRALL